jgi:hypothetical protein
LADGMTRQHSLTAGAAPDSCIRRDCCGQCSAVVTARANGKSDVHRRLDLLLFFFASAMCGSPSLCLDSRRALKRAGAVQERLVRHTQKRAPVGALLDNLLDKLLDRTDLVHMNSSRINGIRGVFPEKKCVNRAPVASNPCTC